MKNKRGITLIALIITIIVLLILAGVVINMTVGNNGIIEKSQVATEKYKEQQVKEQLELLMTEAKLQAIDEKQAFTAEYFKTYLETKLGNKVQAQIDESGALKVTLNGYEFEISIVNGNAIIGTKGQAETVQNNIFPNANADTKMIYNDEEITGTNVLPEGEYYLVFNESTNKIEVKTKSEFEESDLNTSMPNVKKVNIGPGGIEVDQLNYPIITSSGIYNSVKNGKYYYSSKISTLAENAMPIEVYDGKTDTSIRGYNMSIGMDEDEYGWYIDVAEKARGRTKFKCSSWVASTAYSWISVQSYDSQGNKQQLFFAGDGGHNIEFAIPENCVKLKISLQSNTWMGDITLEPLPYNSVPNSFYDTRIIKSSTDNDDNESYNCAAYNAFDNNDNTFWTSSTSASMPQYIGWDFQENVTVYKFSIKNRCDMIDKNVLNFKLQGYNSNGQWEDIRFLYKYKFR